MGMTDKQFNSYIRFILAVVRDVLENLPEGSEKNRLQELADNLQTTLED